MRYWYDTEFIESGPERPIELVSIGIVAEDGREYYAQGTWFHPEWADNWVWENVFLKMKICPGNIGLPYLNALESQSYHEAGRCRRTDCPWRTRREMVDGVMTFMDIAQYGEPELLGYYSAYDHVVFCQLFGSMECLPKGFPMYTRDIKQWQDELGIVDLPEQEVSEHHALADAKWHRHLWQVLQEKDVIWGEA
jgi:hypothetical protein